MAAAKGGRISPSGFVKIRKQSLTGGGEFYLSHLPGLMMIHTLMANGESELACIMHRPGGTTLSEDLAPPRHLDN